VCKKNKKAVATFHPLHYNSGSFLKRKITKPKQEEVLMATKIEFKDRLAFSADVVMEKMLDMDFIEKWSVVQAAINPKATLKDNNGERALIHIDLEEPIPAFGNIKAQMNFEWDIKKRFCTWKRTADGVGGKSKVSGTTEIIADGDNACTFIDVINVEIKMPVIGKKIEKGVLKHIDDGRKEKMDFLTKNLG